MYKYFSTATNVSHGKHYTEKNNVVCFNSIILIENNLIDLTTVLIK